MKLRRSVLAALSLVLASILAAPAMAHEGHHGPIEQDDAAKIASINIERLVDAGKLERSWKEKAKLQTADLVPDGKAKKWALTYQNPDATDASKRTLYVFLNEHGKYLVANFTGP